MFNFFKRKKDIEKIKEETKTGFEFVKKDINALSGWIKHLNSEKDLQKKGMEEIKEDLSSIKQEIESLKNVLSLMNELKTNKVFKTNRQVFNKQMDVYDIQQGVQTSVQTINLDIFSVTERAIIWVLLNSDLKLSYEDISAMLGKEKSTIRGQINSIKQKSESLIKEEIEKNGKKRVFIDEKVKEKILKKTKVSVKNKKNTKKDKKSEEK